MTGPSITVTLALPRTARNESQMLPMPEATTGQQDREVLHIMIAGAAQPPRSFITLRHNLYA